MLHEVNYQMNESILMTIVINFYGDNYDVKIDS